MILGIYKMMEYRISFDYIHDDDKKYKMWLRDVEKLANKKEVLHYFLITFYFVGNYRAINKNYIFNHFRYL